MALIGSVVPEFVARAEEFGDVGAATLFPAEEAYVADAVDRRRREFATVRHCARRALATLGMPPVAIPRGPSGAPSWPDGLVGSMTHCDGYRAAVLAYRRDVAAIGIDAEPHDRLPDGVLDVVSRPAERTGLRDLGDTHPGVHWDRLLFSAKESVYKAWSPLTGRWLDFDEVEVVFDPAGTFEAYLLVPGPTVAGRPVAAFSGRFVVAAGLIATAVLVPGA
ncbi:4'-phosphopantetheinyl transferase family protein [Plantactinospora endophytica]|uniref:4'-phosphopantetheinyl transferase n=1 Tax=Plantactinospora endophytica TaxID=673535 RepID=A0ABQ4EEX7_9ACTN|nr:4'-phosphopantetheinyl transferase superfamily protein [Plantactinospora endophytica]GIG93215.1 4'-phosphopantetheinyl transferase [Plantactinospora endophytica]